MKFKIALSNYERREDDEPRAAGLWAELWGSKKARGILTSAVLCLAIATAAALSDFRNSAFLNLGGAEGKFSDEASKPRPQGIGSTGSPDRGGASSWSLDYLVQANASFIRAAKEKVVQLIVKVPPIAPAPAAADPNAGAAAPAYGGPARFQVPAQLADSALAAMKQGAPKRPVGFSSPLPPPSRNFQSGGSPKIVGVAVASSPTPPPRPAVSSPRASYSHQNHPAARAVVGGRYQTGSASGQTKSQRDRNYSYGQ